MTLVCLKQVREDPYYWKWAVVALHNSLQGFMVCALSDAEGYNVLKDRVAARIKKAKEKGEKPPPPELDTFLNLYRKVKSDKMLLGEKSRLFRGDAEKDKAVRQLNRLRNAFLHFKHKQWHTDVKNLPPVFSACLQIIHFLFFQSGNIQADQEERQRVSFLLNQLKEELRLTAAYYETSP